VLHHAGSDFERRSLINMLVLVLVVHHVTAVEAAS
jgi:hypothetical protein